MHLLKTILASVLLLCFIGNLDAASKTSYKDAHKAVKAAIKEGKKEPKWFKSTKVHWDMKKPWKEGRKEIRRLLEFDAPEKKHEAMKILYLYRKQGWDVVQGEWGEYPFLAGQHAMALAHFLEEIPKIKKHEPTYLKRCLASLYAHYGAYDKALKTLEDALKKVETRPATDKFKIARIAWVHEDIGDLYVKMGEIDKAKQFLKEAADLYPQSKQPYGREKLKPSQQRCMRKIDRLDIKDIASKKLKDGKYNAQQQGYSGIVKVQVTVSGGKISNCTVTSHKEKIHQGSIKSVPAAISKAKTIEVDAVQGATVTSDAIKDSAFQCLKQAGL